MWAFIVFNVGAALFFYWLARVPRRQKVLDVPSVEQEEALTRQATKESMGGKGEKKEGGWLGRVSTSKSGKGEKGGKFVA